MVSLGLVLLAAQGCGAGGPFTTQLGTSGAGVDDEATGITADRSGQVYVTGKTKGAFLRSSNAGGFDALVIKFDGDGLTRWTRALGTSGDETATEVAADDSGNVYVVGYTSGSFSGFTSAGMQDVFVVKLDGDGTIQWLQQFGTDGDDLALAIATDGDGAIYVAGNTTGSFPGHTNAGSTDPFIVKLDAGGAQQWLQQPGTSETERINGLATDGSGNVFLAGSINTGELGLRELLMKYEGSGSQQWVRSGMGNAASDIAVDGSGNLYVVGNNSFGSARSLSITKLDGERTVLWNKRMGGHIDNQRTGGTGVALDSGGNVVIAGHTDENLDGSTNAGGSDLLVAKLDGAGTVQWTRLAGTSGTDIATGVAVDGSGNIFAAGYTVGRFPSTSGYDIVLMKYRPDGSSD